MALDRASRVEVEAMVATQVQTAADGQYSRVCRARFDNLSAQLVNHGKALSPTHDSVIRLEGAVEDIKKAVNGIATSLHGNGEPGIFTKVRQTELAITDLKTQSTERRQHRLTRGDIIYRSILGVGVAVLSGILMLMVKGYIQSYIS